MAVSRDPEVVKEMHRWFQVRCISSRQGMAISRQFRTGGVYWCSRGEREDRWVIVDPDVRQAETASTREMQLAFSSKPRAYACKKLRARLDDIAVMDMAWATS